MEISGFAGRTAACMSTGNMFFIIREVVFEFFSGKRVKNSREALVPSTCKFLFEKGFFSLQYPVKTVTENVCFQERSPK